jgi:hypothetical protein
MYFEYGVEYSKASSLLAVDINLVGSNAKVNVYVAGFSRRTDCFQLICQFIGGILVYIEASRRGSD